MQRKPFISCCCSRQTLKERRAGSGKAAQTKRQLTWVRKKSKYRVSVCCFCLLKAQCLALSSFSVTRLCPFTRAWTWSGIFLFFPCPHLLLPAILGWAAFTTCEGWCSPLKMCGSMYWKSQSKAEFFSLEGIPSEITHQLQTLPGRAC